jgi:hypothetical protein
MTTTIPVNSPAASSGDLLIAYIAAGSTGNTSLPVFTAPTGWTLLGRTDHTTIGSLVVYWKIATSAEPLTDTWSASEPVIYAAWILAYGGVDTAQPIDAFAALDLGTAGTQFATPPLTTTGPGELVVATFAGHSTGTTLLSATWSLPPGTTSRVNFNNAQARSGASFDAPAAVAGAVLPVTSTAMETQDFAATHVVAIRPCH